MNTKYLKDQNIRCCQLKLFVGTSVEFGKTDCTRNNESDTCKFQAVNERSAGNHQVNLKGYDILSTL